MVDARTSDVRYETMASSHFLAYSGCVHLRLESGCTTVSRRALIQDSSLVKTMKEWQSKDEVVLLRCSTSNTQYSGEIMH